MAKNVIFCADGTWDGPGEVEGDAPDTPASNVFKAFVNLQGIESAESLKLAKEQEKTLMDPSGARRQVAKYLDGVGDSTNILDKLLGGAAGAGLITRVVRGYTFLSRNYEAGDNLFLIGFSRGAYTARALGGLIAAKGLLDGRAIDLTNKEAAYRAGCAVWYDYRRIALQGDSNGLGKLEETILDLPAFVSRPKVPDLLTNVGIRCIGVWDTVGALGIPEYTRQRCRIDAFEFCNTVLSASVAHGLHAVSLDERRADFTPTLWSSDVRIKQALFPGAHADVGGGYPIENQESGLSDGASEWMRSELQNLGVLFTAPLRVIAHATASGPAHKPWIKPPWNALPTFPQGRPLPIGLMLHHSVLERLAAGDVVPDPSEVAASYAPLNLAAYVTKAGPSAGVTVV